MHTFGQGSKNTSHQIPNETEADFPFEHADVLLPEKYVQQAQHPIIEAMAELTHGEPKDRAVKLFLLKTIADKTHALTGEGQPEWPTQDDLERGLQSYRITNLSRLLERMHKRGLLEVYDRPYRYGITPAGSTILAFFHLAFDFHDETGLASAIIANINLIQLRKTANASLRELRLVFGEILYQIGRLNLKLKTALQNRIRSELDQVSADLEVIQAHIKPLRDLSEEFARQAQNDEIDSGRVVAWLNHGRQIINDFESLAHSITGYYLVRASRGADSHLAIDNIEAMLADYATQNDGWQKIMQWGYQLDRFVGLGHIPVRALLEAYQIQSSIDNRLVAQPVPTTSVTVQQDEIYRWTEDEDGEAETLADLLEQNGITHISKLVDPVSWSITVGRICALNDALELLKDRTSLEWGVAVIPGITTFSEQAEVKQITNAEIRSWMNLNTIRNSPPSRNGS